MKSLRPPCQHESIILQPVLIQGSQYVAISCGDPGSCFEIYLLDTQTRKATSAYKASNLYPGKMCVGEQGTLYAENLKCSPKEAKQVVKLDIRDKLFKDTGHRVNSGMETIYGMHYTSTGAQKMLIFSYWGTNTLQAVNAESGTVIWKVQGEVAGKLCDPHGITSTKEGHVIIADGDNCRLLVLNAGSGELINTHDLRECDGAVEPHLINNDKEMVLWYRYQGKEHIAYYNIN